MLVVRGKQGMETGEGQGDVFVVGISRITRKCTCIVPLACYYCLNCDGSLGRRPLGCLRLRVIR